MGLARFAWPHAFPSHPPRYGFTESLYRVFPWSSLPERIHFHAVYLPTRRAALNQKNCGKVYPWSFKLGHPSSRRV